MKKSLDAEADALLATIIRKRTCGVARTGRRDLADTLIAKRASDGQVERIFGEHFNLRVSDSTIRQHRLKTCACFRP